MKYRWAYQLKKQKNETEEDLDNRHRGSGVQEVPDLDASIALYKYPTSREYVQAELNFVRSAIRSHDPLARMAFASLDAKPACWELRLDYLEYRYLLGFHPQFSLWSILRAVIWKYHKTLPIDDPILDAIDDGESPVLELISRMITAISETMRLKQVHCTTCLVELYRAYFNCGGFPLEVKKQDGRLAVLPKRSYSKDDDVTSEWVENDGLRRAPTKVLEHLRSRYL